MMRSDWVYAYLVTRSDETLDLYEMSHPPNYTHVLEA